jgi:hypothetical protein
MTQVSPIDIFEGKRYCGSRDMDGQKIEWIRKELGMSWIDLHRELGISRMTLWRCRKEGAPRLIALAILGLWYSRKMGGLLEEPGEKELVGAPGKRKRSGKKG